MNLQQIQPFLVALAIGLLLGFERERSHSRKLAAGSRSFALLSVSGAIAASFGEWTLVAGLLGICALIALAYLRTSEEDPGTTTEIAAIVTYLLGALAYSRPAVAVALAVVVGLLLVSKSRIHHFAREIVSEVELADAIKFFVVAFVVLPLLPDRQLGPYGVLNPEKLWLIVVLLTGISWVGYIGVRALGPERGLLVTGLAGGFVSASATTASMGRLSKTATGWRAPLASALLASVATFVQLMIVIGFVDAELLRCLWLPVVAATIVLMVVVAFVYRSASRNRQDAPESGEGAAAASPSRPFALRPALLLAAILTIALLIARWAAAELGPQAVTWTAFAAGLADAHAGSVTAATLAARGDISVDSALVAVAAALGSNLLVKVTLAFTLGSRRFGLGFLAGMGAPAAVFGVGLTLALRG